MGWIARSLAGPVLWAVLFSTVYALHGIGCAAGWPYRPILGSDLHHLTLWSTWGAGLILHVILIIFLPQGTGIKRFLIVSGLWIGLVSSIVTLFPIIALSSCLAN